MNAASSTVLVTGGASGIGLALAERFQRAGSRVVVCGRRREKLREAAERLPGLLTRACDLALPGEREALHRWVTSEVPEVNVLVNNAGIQRRFRLTEPEPWEETEREIAIDFDAAVHLTLLFLPHLRTRTGAAIVNVTSGLAFVPMASAPVYSATKAALHSFTLSLRVQLAGTGVDVVEVIPPAVNTDLGGPGLHTAGAPLDDFADSVMQRLLAGQQEIPYGTSERSSRASRAELEEIFQRMNRPRD
jgi:uncharacterized oxidoreductase